MDTLNLLRATQNKLYNGSLYIGRRYAKINDDYAIISVSKCGCSTAALLAQEYTKKNVVKEPIENFTFKHLNDINRNYWSQLDAEVMLKERPNCKIVAIYRDPIERFISAKHTIAPNEDWEVYTKIVLQTLKNNSKDNIDQHILPQHYFYNLDEVDIFVELKDLSNFLQSIGVNPIAVNQRKNKQNNIECLDKYLQELKQLYAEDYKMISEISKNKKYINELR